ncbi:MAG: hypothetical protein SangKO_057420 [Sandaracinaceae bacterium]
MGCAIGCLALAFPRVALVLVWLLGPDAYLSRAFPGLLWLILGFLFLPLTTLAFAFASNSIGPMNDVTPFGWLLVILALLVDLGLLGGGGRAARRRREDAD